CSAITGAATTREGVSRGPAARRWASPSSWCAATRPLTGSRPWCIWIGSRTTGPTLPRRSNAERVRERTQRRRIAMFKRMLAFSAGATVVFAALLVRQPAEAQDKEPTGKAAPASKVDLTPESLPKLLVLVRPQENEWRHLKVQWLTDVVAARKRAAAEDRPIVICYTGGAGYNEPPGTR